MFRSCLDYISMLDFLRIYNPSLHIGLSCVINGMACLLRGSNLHEYIYIYIYSIYNIKLTNSCMNGKICMELACTHQAVQRNTTFPGSRRTVRSDPSTAKASVHISDGV